MIRVVRCYLVVLAVVLNMTFPAVAAISLPASFLLGSENEADYLPSLAGKRVALVVNHTSVNQANVHVVDQLLAKKVNVVKLFVPEHGFRGQQAAGEGVDNERDAKTGIPIISLYGSDKQGSKRKPHPRDLRDVDVFIFDIQDVGVRFYTYISTLHYILEAAAEQGKQVIVFDRPNPNGDQVDGQVLDRRFQSFVGMHPIPIVHGLTIGELANMINGEEWLAGGITLSPDALVIVPMSNYQHAMPYILPIAPSPNLRDPLAIRLYSSLGLFESTPISVGRGTNEAFTVIGYPDKQMMLNHAFQVSDDASAWPQRGQYCYGEKLAAKALVTFDLRYFYDWYYRMQDAGYAPTAIIDRPEWLAKLYGSDALFSQLKKGASLAATKTSWQPELTRYKAMREKYLLYP